MTIKFRPAKRTSRQRRFAKMLRKHPVVIARSSPDCRVSEPFREDRVAGLVEADRGWDHGGICDGGLPETDRRRF
jgi:hypothetical protein